MTMPTVSRRAGLAAAIVFAAALVSTLPVIWRVVIPLLDGSNLKTHLGHGLQVYVHAVGGAFMLGAGAGALFIGWTGRLRRFHKGFGYTYLVAARSVRPWRCGCR